jgi:hypothetical protein
MDHLQRVVQERLQFDFVGSHVQKLGLPATERTWQEGVIRHFASS